MTPTTRARNVCRYRLHLATPWYERLFGRLPDFVSNENEVMWRVAENCWLPVIQDVERARRTVVTILVSDLDQFVEDLASRGIKTGTVEAVGFAKSVCLPKCGPDHLGGLTSGQVTLRRGPVEGSEHVTILFTDLVGSTGLASLLSPEEADEIRRVRLSGLRQAIARDRRNRSEEPGRRPQVRRMRPHHGTWPSAGVGR